MASDVTRSEFQHLEARVSVLEGEVEGEKVVSRYILEQTRRNGDDLAAVKTRLGRVEIDVAALKTDVASLKADMRRLRDDLPGIVGGAVREAFAERGGPA